MRKQMALRNPPEFTVRNDHELIPRHASTGLQTPKGELNPLSRSRIQMVDYVHLRVRREL
jgi:hypothetical protein